MCKRRRRPADLTEGRLKSSSTLLCYEEIETVRLAGACLMNTSAKFKCIHCDCWGKLPSSYVGECTTRCSSPPDGLVNLVLVVFPESSHPAGLLYRGFRLARAVEVVLGDRERSLRTDPYSCVRLHGRQIIRPYFVLHILMHWAKRGPSGPQQERGLLRLRQIRGIHPGRTACRNQPSQGPIHTRRA